MKKYFAFVFLILAMLACNFSSPAVSAPSPTPQPTTVVYVVIEPTATPTIVLTNTPESTPTPTLPPEITLVKNSNCRKGPSEYYYISDQIAKDKDNVPTVLSVIAQNEDGTWLQVINATNQECWIFAENTQPNSDFSSLPIEEGLPLPANPGSFLVTNQLCQPGANKHEVSFSWTGGAEIDGFHIYRNGSRIIELKADRFNYKDVKALMEINLVYELEAFNENGTSQKATQIVTACK